MVFDVVVYMVSVIIVLSVTFIIKGVIGTGRVRGGEIRVWVRKGGVIIIWFTIFFSKEEGFGL